MIIQERFWAQVLDGEYLARYISTSLQNTVKGLRLRWDFQINDVESCDTNRIVSGLTPVFKTSNHNIHDDELRFICYLANITPLGKTNDFDFYVGKYYLVKVNDGKVWMFTKMKLVEQSELETNLGGRQWIEEKNQYHYWLQDTLNTNANTKD